MSEDTYEGFAERYDWMRQENLARQKFFRQLFAKYGVTNVLDCACGTGQDLLIFNSMGIETHGSDLSEAMLAVAARNTADAGIRLRKADYCELSSSYDMTFDATVCLSNSINEPLEDEQTLRALCSMRSVLRPGGILIFDQGQTDASMQNPSRFVPVVNNRDYTRFFVIEYADKIQTVNICDFIHTEEESNFKHCSVQIRIRLVDSWTDLVRAAGFASVDFYGDWKGAPYDKASSQRLIAVAQR